MMKYDKREVELIQFCAFLLKATASTVGLPITTSGKKTLFPDNEIPSILGKDLFK